MIIVVNGVASYDLLIDSNNVVTSPSAVHAGEVTTDSALPKPTDEILMLVTPNQYSGTTINLPAITNKLNQQLKIKVVMIGDGNISIVPNNSVPDLINGVAADWDFNANNGFAQIWVVPQANYWIIEGTGALS